MRKVILLGLLATLACGDDDAEPESTPETVTPTPTTEPDPDPLEGLDDIEALENEMPDPVAPSVTADTVDIAVPERGCATFGEEAVRVWPRTGPANVVAVGADGFVIVGYAANADGNGEDVWAVALRSGQAARPVFRDGLEHALSVPRTAAPGLGRVDDGHVGIVTVDGAASVRYAVVQTGGRAEAWRNVGFDADQRFTPATGVRGGRHVVAYTDGGGEHMKLRYVAFDATGRELARHDITPVSMGGAAQTMVDGSDAMLFLDPREAVSPLLQADVTIDPPTTDVFVPLSNVFEPAAIGAAQVGDTTLVAYTAVGMAAATAVGLVTVRDGQGQGPVPIVPSSGYGMLHVDAAAASTRAVFVADKPKARERGAPREVIAIVAEPGANGVTFGEPLTLTTPDGTARWGRIARHADGTYAVVMTAESGVYVHLMRCDEG